LALLRLEWGPGVWWLPSHGPKEESRGFGLPGSGWEQTGQAVTEGTPEVQERFLSPYEVSGGRQVSCARAELCPVWLCRQRLKAATSLGACSSLLSARFLAGSQPTDLLSCLRTRLPSVLDEDAPAVRLL